MSTYANSLRFYLVTAACCFTLVWSSSAAAVDAKPDVPAPANADTRLSAAPATNSSADVSSNTNSGANASAKPHSDPTVSSASSSNAGAATTPNATDQVTSESSSNAKVPPEANPNAVDTLSGKQVPSEGKNVREQVDEGLDKARETGETLRDKAGDVGEGIRKSAQEVGAEVRKGAKAAKEFASDAWISTKVKAALVGEETIRALDIQVSTNDGVVLLEGAVSTAQQRAKAEQLAAEIEGVRAVKNHITFK